MQIDTDITLEDYRTFESFVVNRIFTGTGDKGKSRIRRFVLIMLPAIIFGFILGFSGITPDRTLVFIVMIFALVCLIVLKMAKRKALPLDKGFILGKKTYVLDTNGIKYISENHESFTKWQAVVSIEEVPEHFFIMLDKSAGFVIPKRYLSDKEEEEQFRDLIQECLHS